MPYFSAKPSSPSVSRSEAHSFAAFFASAMSSRSARSAAFSAFLLFADTHLPKLRYFSANAAASSLRSSRQSRTALFLAARRSAASSRAFSDTQAPRLRYWALNASRDSSVEPRSALHSLAAFARSCFVGFATAPDGIARAATMQITINTPLRIHASCLGLTLERRRGQEVRELPPNLRPDAAFKMT